MQRLKDIYYTDKVLDGNVPIEGIKQPSPQFYQGEDIRLSFYLNINGNVVTPDKYNIELILKKSPSATNILWKGQYGAGVYSSSQTVPNGRYYMLMPAEVSALFLPGTYYLDAKVTEKIGTGDLVKDVVTIIQLGTINIDLSAASPNPFLKPRKVQEVTYDPETGVTTVTITSVEGTLPLPINVI